MASALFDVWDLENKEIVQSIIIPGNDPVETVIWIAEQDVGLQQEGGGEKTVQGVEIS